MSLSSTTTIKAQLAQALGPKVDTYYKILQQYFSAQTSREELDEQIKECLGKDNIPLLQLHNSFIVSLLDPSAHLAPPTPPPDAPKPSPRKRRRTLPYQGDDEDAESGTLRSTRLKRWTIGMGKRERDRLRNLDAVALSSERRPRKDLDEVAADRGVVLLPERGEPAGARPPLHLASVTRAPTLQHIVERINLISAQHNLGQPPRAVASLMMYAFEAKLKQLITQALSLTSTSHAITSIKASGRSTTSHLSATSFDTLFTVSPAILPNRSAAAMRLALGDSDSYDDDLPLKNRETRDYKWQMLGLLGDSRSTVKEALRTLR
ncbi:transcriptional regulator of RNA polII, SAGA, subunit-domain-containing protein [Phanerochaete sordida]|uniref:Transcriptional regulator of RNA polII, SAGA, subunit-domain-containing protein n=1 Tax=Phanerochaete sordida TaxID=48140 RepID=A0A9P3GAD0_9APHY|nr:transcriptional regulator of RNA polII, SAGA, subunit-domain-containing protein [Phanerochaete sordida]